MRPISGRQARPDIAVDDTWLQVCLVAKRGNPPAPDSDQGGVGSDIIFSERRGQSQKPEEIYELIEQLVPNGKSDGKVVCMWQWVWRTSITKVRRAGGAWAVGGPGCNDAVIVVAAEELSSSSWGLSCLVSPLLDP